MGKNAAFKQAQAAKGAAQEDAAPPPGPGRLADDGDGIDASFHTSSWHAARLGILADQPRLTLEELKAQQAADDGKKHELAAVQEAAEREYKEAMEAERRRRLGQDEPKQKHKKKDKDKEKAKDKDKGKHKKRKHKSEDKEERKSSKHKRANGDRGTEHHSPRKLQRLESY